MLSHSTAIGRSTSIILAVFVLVNVVVGAGPATGPATRPAAAPWGVRALLPGEAGQPRVLLIGDSILNGYGSLAAEAMRGNARLDAFVTPKHVGSKDLPKDLAPIFAEHAYDVILFNDIGLHAWQPGRIPEGQYEPFLRAHVAMLRRLAPTAKLIFATTTPMTTKVRPYAVDAEFDAVIVGRNEIAKRVMAEDGVPVVDFYVLLANRLDLAVGDRFHWTRPAYAILAKSAAIEIEKSLKQSNAH